jgi:hypothetical protein
MCVWECGYCSIQCRIGLFASVILKCGIKNSFCFQCKSYFIILHKSRIAFVTFYNFFSNEITFFTFILKCGTDYLIIDSWRCIWILGCNLCSILVGYLKPFSHHRLYESNTRTVDKWWIGKDLERSGRGPFKVLSRAFLERMRKTTTGHSYNVSRPKFN